MSETKNNKMMQRVMDGHQTIFKSLICRLFVVNILMIFCLSLTTFGQTPTAPAKEIKNSIGMEFVYIPNGSFEMGSNEGDDEKPVHQVTISNGFYLGKYEVTQAEYKKMVGKNPSYFKNCPRCPVENLSWDDVQKFIVKLNAKGDGTYRLPTEAEWEYSERAGRIGDVRKTLVTGWFKSNSKGKTHVVGTNRANAWGLYDMNGNVWEWVEDLFGNYPSRSVIDPMGASSGSERVFRGGSFYDDSHIFSSEGRLEADPSFTLERIGFRVVRTK